MNLGRLTLIYAATDRQDLRDLIGGIYYPNRLAIGKHALFTDVNQTDHIVKTSPVNKITLEGKGIAVRTENTTYYFEEAD